MRIVLTCIFLFFLLLLGFDEALAQPGGPQVDPDAPITGIEILLGVGGVLGIKKMLSSRNKKD